MDLGLNEKTFVVTGGSKGIGVGIVRAFLAEGARVVNVNRAGPEGGELSSELARAGLGDRYRFVPGDLADVQTCREAVAQTIHHFGRIDGIINNAGVNDSVGLDAGPEAFVASLQKNLIHYYALVHFALDELKRNQGVIVNIGSKVSVTGQGGTSAYAAAKGAINSLTREWAVDLAPSGVRVNAVIPAETWTPLYEKWLRTLSNPSETKARLEHSIPLGHRFTTIEEIANTVVFVASPRSSHTTGQILFVDGGYTHFDRKCTTVKD